MEGYFKVEFSKLFFTVEFVSERSEEHTSELQSQSNLVCRLLLEKKNQYSGREARSLRTNISSSTARSQRSTSFCMPPYPLGLNTVVAYYESVPGQSVYV